MLSQTKAIACVVAGLCLAACSPSAVVVDAGPMAAPPANHERPSDGIWGTAFETIEGRATTLGEFAGKTILVVNTASRCGYTPQFEGLERIHQRFKARGLVILGFPCNQFLSQDPGTDEEIADFCRVNYGVTFAMMSKIDVKGSGIHPLFAHLTQQSAESLRGEVSWNFEKFLIRPDGVPLARFRSSVEPEDDRVIQAIEAALP